MEDFLLTVPNHIKTLTNNLILLEDPATYQEEVLLLLDATVLARGKRFRPLLTYLIGDLFAVDLATISPFARAIELLHAASLAHDDVIDNATYRRSRPSINVVASNKKAVLAGDMLFAEVIVQVAKQGNLFLAQEIAAVIKQLATGEWLQLRSVEQQQFSHDIIRKIAQMKTASVISWSCLVGPYLAQAPTPIIEKLRFFGQNLGMAFQLRDDVLDFTGDGKKNSLLDLQNGIINAVTFEWLQTDPSLKSKFYLGESLVPYTECSSLHQAIQQVAIKVDEYLDLAMALLEDLGQLLIAEHFLPAQEVKTHSRPLISLVDNLRLKLGKQF